MILCARRCRNRSLIWISGAILIALAASLTIAKEARGGTLKIVVPVPPGGALDGLARHLAMRITGQSGEAVVVDNRPGALGLIGTLYVVGSPGDGNTLLMAGSFLATNALTVKSGPDPTKDLKPVVSVAEMALYLAARSGLEASGPGDLERLAQQHPEGFNCGAIPGQLALGCERLKVLLGGQVVSIPYSGIAPAVNALATGQIDLLFSTHSSLSQMAEAGKIQVLASLDDRCGKPPFDKLPLLKDTWPDFVMNGWSGVFAPASTPDAVVERLNRQLNAALADPELRKLLEAQGYTIVGGKPEELASTLTTELALYRGIVDSIGKSRQ